MAVGLLIFGRNAHPAAAGGGYADPQRSHPGGVAGVMLIIGLR